MLENSYEVVLIFIIINILNTILIMEGFFDGNLQQFGNVRNGTVTSK